MRIDTRQIPDEGLLLESEENPAIFDLQDEGIRAVSPLRYRLHVSIQDSELFVEGFIEATFELRCVRCLEPFRKTVRLDPYQLVEDFENQGIVDLTDRVREDILLDLPGYPKCEEADSARKCPALDKILPDSDYQPIIDVSENEKDVWKALDNLEPEKDQDS